MQVFFLQTGLSCHNTDHETVDQLSHTVPQKKQFFLHFFCILANITFVFMEDSMSVKKYDSVALYMHVLGCQLYTWQGTTNENWPHG